MFYRQKINCLYTSKSVAVNFLNMHMNFENLLYKNKRKDYLPKKKHMTISRFTKRGFQTPKRCTVTSSQNLRLLNHLCHESSIV